MNSVFKIWASRFFTTFARSNQSCTARVESASHFFHLEDMTQEVGLLPFVLQSNRVAEADLDHAQDFGP